jgi:hypothetical protein
LPQQPAAFSPQPPGPLGRPPLVPPATPGDPGQTAAGLTRRVRGAQLPNTQTVSLRRSSGDITGGRRTAPRPGGPGPTPLPPLPDGGAVGGPFGRTPTGQNPVVRPSQPPSAPRPQPQPPAAPEEPDEGWASERSAKDVYGFLSDFTAGVQKGLDETKKPTDG